MSSLGHLPDLEAERFEFVPRLFRGAAAREWSGAHARLLALLAFDVLRIAFDSREAARSCTCFALSGFVKAPSGTTNPSSFNRAWARRASAARGFAPSAVLTLS